MGKKRKREYSEEEIQRKIKKLQKKLQKSTSHRVLSSSEEDNICSPGADSPLAGSSIFVDIDEDQLRIQSPQAVSTYERPSHQNSLLPRTLSQSERPSSPTPGTSADIKQPETIEEQDLDEDILKLLGDAPILDSPMGPPIHKDIANRWQDILLKGLSKDLKENLMKDYRVPSNCDLLITPTLNPEVKAAIQDTMVKRDSSLMYKQKQLGIALSALATATNLIISNETSQQKLLKPISDACRILCDSHFMETKTRRNFIVSSINANLKDALIETKRDKLLFGENVAEKLKAAKSIQQSGDALKTTQKPRFNKPNNTTKSFKGRLNFAPQHRKTDNKLSDTRRAPRPAPRAQYGGVTSRRRSPPPPPPPRTATRR